MRLIDADKLLADNGLGHECNDCEQNTYECGNYRRYTLMSFCEMVDTAPTVDAAPVRHGYWVWHESDYEYECSACGCRFDYERTYLLFDHDFEYANYCPNCGAKMIGGV